MVIVGELINASRKSVAGFIEAQDAGAIQELARKEFEAGAQYIDVNAGTFVGRESHYLKWLVTVVQEAVNAPCCIDSPDPDAIEAGLSVHRGAPMINSISLEKGRYDRLLPMVAGTDFKVVALCMSDEGMPETVDDRMAIADKLVNGLLRSNVKMENIYVDPLVQPLSVNKEFGREFLNSIEKITAAFPGIHTMCGLSNISYGLPNRKFLNQAFVVMAIGKGLDGAIVNPLDRRMMANIIAAEALAGRDDYCMNYLKGHRAGKFELE
ncbi:MAG: methyltetrahydrofolate cobalamin methyltransferase [Syntrophobacteraceae bacterium]|nr:methyltetrahydrofolate cobalamin methyltransferase [Desulfobacteraceae bacterium]